MSLDDCPGFQKYGNGDCDASLNKEACGYDGGDCCQEFVDCVFTYQSTIVTYCEGDECNCHLTNQSHCDSWKREPIGDLGIYFQFTSKYDSVQKALTLYFRKLRELLVSWEL